jgi:UDP-N-acetylglucosamine 2-epimerase
VSADENEVISAIQTVYILAFKAQLQNTVPPYGQVNRSRRVIDVLKNINLSSSRIKKFYDISQ